MTGDKSKTRLFNKTELFIRGLVFKEVHLGSVSDAVADLLGVEREKMLVVDAIGDTITLDVLKETLDANNLISREKEILRALSLIDGVTVTPNTHIHSEGVLGFISLELDSEGEFIRKVDQTESNIAEKISKRCLVFPTGDEIIAGSITDTNTPFLVDALKTAGFYAQSGDALPDDEDVIFGRLMEAAMQGFGVVITTGGTGAEKKDCIVEAIQKLDADAATPYTVHFTKGQGRHHKDGVRIAVGRRDLTTYVALTGPHQEVVQVTETLIEGLTNNWTKRKLAHSLAGLIRANFG